MNPTLAPCIIKTVTSNSFPATILLDEMQSQIGPHITVLVAVHLQLISLVKLGPCPITFAALRWDSAVLVLTALSQHLSRQPPQIFLANI